jgi:hypothetical protein
MNGFIMWRQCLSIVQSFYHVCELQCETRGSASINIFSLEGVIMPLNATPRASTVDAVFTIFCGKDPPRKIWIVDHVCIPSTLAVQASQDELNSNCTQVS